MSVPTSVSFIGSALASESNPFNVDLTQRNPLGMVIQDGAGGEWIYLPGVASTALGSWVTYNHLFVTALLAADAVGQVAVACAAVIASTWGWFCIKSPLGGITGKCDTIASGDVPVYIDGTAGRVDDASVAGDYVFGVVARSADTANLAVFQIDHPFVCNGGYLV